MNYGTVTIEGKKFSAENNVLIVAEIGTSHRGSLERAKELIDAACDSGADCAKFQIVYADEILHPETGTVSLPGGEVPLYDRFREMEVPLSFYQELKSYCEGKKLIFLCSPFGLRSARELRSLSPSCIKIASPELNHFPLLRETAGYGLPLILSTGVSRLSDIERALEETEAANEKVLLHCVTSYPAPEEDYNLNIIQNLSAIFGIPVGVSDHSLDPVLIPVLSAACGACIIEKHICLSRSDPGLDDPVALPSELFEKMTLAVRDTQGKDRESVLEVLAGRYGREKIISILGSGQKKLAASERQNYGRTNRSIHAVRNLNENSVIQKEDVALLRTEKKLNPGLSPEFLNTVIGAHLSRTVPDGAGIEWADIICTHEPPLQS
ncbi:N-acetylneuraminate synthase family protein [Brucepastera parasyntrophica]|uniref:N-acetylneuraminate synthase family protein n=1 Tax=Brucepastera parasyntrophica TaxID=2880008 RepID=UPI00210C77A4|nr:N-acetylneuraminate synthase family protein [Brucepastera parasyntrophica]ULQ60113.1 N-acetylneuraminate synthase family protein [Brucepastera parasyntrophica]